MLLNITIPEPGATAPRRYHCERCNGRTHSHATNNHRQIADTRLSEIQQRRFKCTRCGRTFPSYPEGISRGAQRTNRVKKALGVLFYVPGLSYRQGASVVKALAGKTCPSTLYNDVQRAGACAEELHRKATRTVRLIGLLLKMRSKVMRGFVKPENIKKFVYLSGYLWSHRHACNLSLLFN